MAAVLVNLFVFLQVHRVPGRGQLNGKPTAVPAPAGRAGILKKQPSEVRVPAMSQELDRPEPGGTRPKATTIKVEPGFNKRGTSGER